MSEDNGRANGPSTGTSPTSSLVDLVVLALSLAKHVLFSTDLTHLLEPLESIGLTFFMCVHCRNLLVHWS
jgi:hypothetical protein